SLSQVCPFALVEVQTMNIRERGLQASSTLFKKLAPAFLFEITQHDPMVRPSTGACSHCADIHRPKCWRQQQCLSAYLLKLAVDSNPKPVEPYAYSPALITQIDVKLRCLVPSLAACRVSHPGIHLRARSREDVQRVQRQGEPRLVRTLRPVLH